MIRSIAILKPSALGDIVHALPVLGAVRARFPDAHVTWVVNRAYRPLLAGHQCLDATLPFDRGAFRRPLSAVRYAGRFAAELRRQRFDLVLDLQGLLRTGLMAAATGAPHKWGFANAREGATRFYTHHINVPDADTAHAVDRYWRFADELGVGHITKRFDVPLDPAEVEAARKTLSPLPRPWVAVAAGSRWVTKCWPPASFAELLNRGGGSAVFVGTADDTALSLDAASRLRGPWLDLTGKTTLPRLAAVLSLADVMLGNDTGPLHLAAGLGRPCVAPYTCTKPAKHGPYGVPGGGVATTVACGGSYFKRCPHALECMADLTPDRLWPAFAEVLSACQPTRRSA